MKINIKNSLLIIVGLLILTACGKIDYSKIIGTWKLSDEAYSATYTFNEDKTGKYTLTVGEERDSKRFTYKIDNKNIYITFEKDTDVFENKYKLKDDNLIIEDSFGEKMVFNKVNVEGITK